MTEVIHVCQECGHYIEPLRIPGTDRALVLCCSDDCTLARLGPVGLSWAQDTRRLADPLLLPIVSDPRAPFRVTGVL